MVKHIFEIRNSVLKNLADLSSTLLKNTKFDSENPDGITKIEVAGIFIHSETSWFDYFSFPIPTTPGVKLNSTGALVFEGLLGICGSEGIIESIIIIDEEIASKLYELKEWLSKYESIVGIPYKK